MYEQFKSKSKLNKKVDASTTNRKPFLEKLTQSLYMINE